MQCKLCDDSADHTVKACQKRAYQTENGHYSSSLGGYVKLSTMVLRALIHCYIDSMYRVINDKEIKEYGKHYT